MKKKTLPETKQTHYRRWKSGKTWVFASATLLILFGAASIPITNHTFSPTTVLAAAIAGGAQIGSVNGTAVYQSETNDTGSSSFQSLVDSIIQSDPSALSGVQYVGTKIGWTAQTRVIGPGVKTLGDLVPADLNSFVFGTPAGLPADGYQAGDAAAHMKVGDKVLLMNTGYVTDVKTGQQVPVNIEITYQGMVHGNDGQTSTDAVVAFQDRGTAIHIGGMNISYGTDAGGGESESGGGGGSGSGSTGNVLAYMDQITYSAQIVRSDTGQALPSGSLLMAQKISDIDAKQKAVADNNNALGYIVSPDTNLSPTSDGFVADSSGATNSDSTNLSSNDLIVLKKYTTIQQKYAYTDGKGDHFDIDTGFLGYLNFDINIGGYVQIDKATVQYGKNSWNQNYAFDPIKWQVIDKDGKVVATLALGSDGKSPKSDLLPPGDYTLHEISDNWSLTGQTQHEDIQISVASGQTTTVSGDKVNNTAVVGQNTLNKSDVETGKNKNGKAVMMGAQYKLIHLDDATGSSPHKNGDAVTWAEIPNPSLVVGKKATSGVVNGQTIDYKDNVVIEVNDPSKLDVGAGNLPEGKYAWVEVNAPEGYALDATVHEFTIAYKDEHSPEVVAPDVDSKEQVIKAKVPIQKLVEALGESASSGFNGIEFTATPIDGTAGDPVKVTTGIKPVTDEDGYAAFVLAYGDYLITETKGIDGYDNIKPIYVRMSNDIAKDLITITTSNSKDPKDPVLSTRTFSISDNLSEDNPNATGTIAGKVSSTVPVISLSKMVFTDKATKPVVPSIDVEKADGDTPKAGTGNDTDTPNNLGVVGANASGDHDTADTAKTVEAGKDTPISFRVTNNGSEALSHIKVSDKTTDGSVSVKDITWDFKTNDQGELIGQDGQLLVLQPGETFTGHGTLPALPGDELHGDEVAVTGVGVKTNQPVGDHDKWYGKTNQPKEPSIDVEKADGDTPNAGSGNDQDAANNIGANDHDTADTAKTVEAGKNTPISFRVTNNGSEALSHIKVSDKTTGGSVSIKDITWDFKTNDQGELVGQDGQLLILQPGETFTGYGTLPALKEGELHSDEVAVSGVGITSGKPVGDHDKWYGQVTSKPNVNIFLPHTGEELLQALPYYGGILLGAAAALWKRKAIGALFSKLFSKVTGR